MDILTKIKKADLVGRGGACFPVATKWDMVKNTERDPSTSSGQETKYVICNASEGEPGVKKDGYILEHFGEQVIDGMKIAIDFLSDAALKQRESRGIRASRSTKRAVKAYLFINHYYYKKFAKKLNEVIKDSPIELFIKPIDSGYIGGEESAILNIIEGKRAEPRLRPPFPTTQGLWGCPTLINNVETFYNVSLVAADEFKNKRFYTVTGDCLCDGIYELPDSYTIEKVLKETNNYPNFLFFVQAGGDVSGEILNNRQLKRPASGAGSIKIYSQEKYKPIKVIQQWLDFFINESCGKCTPCREGIYRLHELLQAKIVDWQLLGELLNNLDESSFCGLGCVVPIPIKSYVKNVLANMPENKISLGKDEKRMICKCFK